MIMMKRKCLVVITLKVTLISVIDGFGSDLFVILLKGSEILTSFGELTFFHTLTDIPVNEGTLGVHKIELVIDTGKDLSDGGGVGHHADSTLDLSQIAAGNDGRRLVVDTTLETGRAPIDELDGTLGLDGGDSGVDILGDDITTVHHTASHVLTVTRIALNHLGCRLEDGVGDLSDGKLLMVSLLSRDDRSVRGQGKVNTRVRHQVSLELSDIDVQSTIETKGSSQRRDDLSDQTIQVGVSRTLNVQRTTADIIDGLVVQHKSDISVLQKRVSRQHGVVRLNNSGGYLRGRVDGETELGLLSVINRKTLQEERTKTGTGTTTNGVEDQETLETSTVVSQLTDAVQSKVNNLLTNGVVTTGVVVGSIFLTGDQLLRVKQLTVSSGADLIDNSRLQIEEDSTRDVLAGTSFREKGVESIITTTDGLVRRHLTIRLDSMLQTVKLPTSITDLTTSLTEMNRDDFAHCNLRVRV
jgi:hypothetical protein